MAPWNDAGRNAVMTNVRGHVERVGCAVIGVGEDTGFPTFSYSVGLYDRFQAAEIIVVGLAPRTAMAVINNVRDEAAHGIRYGAGDTSATVANMPMRFVTVTDRWRNRLCGAARQYYGRRSFSVVQLVWSDRAGRFPGEDGFDVATFGAVQPLLNHDAHV